MRACKEKNIRSLAGNSSLESFLTEENWKAYAPLLAEDQFPLESYAKFTTPQQDNFGIITRIDTAGNIHVKSITVREAKQKKENGILYIYYQKEALLTNEIKFVPDFSERTQEITWRASNRYAFSLLCPLQAEDDLLYERLKI